MPLIAFVLTGTILALPLQAQFQTVLWVATLGALTGALPIYLGVKFFDLSLIQELTAELR